MCAVKKSCLLHTGSDVTSGMCPVTGANDYNIQQEKYAVNNGNTGVDA